MPKRKAISDPVTRGSGNVSADLGFENPAEKMAKAQLAMMLDDVIRERGLSTTSREHVMQRTNNAVALVQRVAGDEQQC